MAYELKELTGSLFVNNKTSDKSPDFRGDFLIEGKKYEVAGWKRLSQSGKAYISCVLKLDEPAAAAPNPKVTTIDNLSDDGDFPF